MKTRDRIIHTAIRLFNTHGIARISIRNLAAELNISHGNLEYHFKNKEELILAVYHQMIEEMSGIYPKIQHQKLTLKDFNSLLVHLENFQIKYRFFHLDLIEIARDFKKVNRLLDENMRFRKKQMALYFEQFLADKLLQDKGDANYYGYLQHTMRIMITFWLLQKEIISGYNFKKRGEMTHHIWGLLVPNMTEKGRREYRKTVENDNN